MRIVIFAPLILMVACSQATPERPVDATSRTSVVGKYEDCTLYRTNTTFGPDITWVRCKKEPKVVEAVHTESCGKGCTRQVKTITVEEVKE